LKQFPPSTKPYFSQPFELHTPQQATNGRGLQSGRTYTLGSVRCSGARNLAENWDSAFVRVTYGTGVGGFTFGFARLIVKRFTNWSGTTPNPSVAATYPATISRTSHLLAFKDASAEVFQRWGLKITLA
jgi:hypothetical protein